MEKLSWKSKISFGIGAFGKDAVYALVGTYFMFYLTDIRLVNPFFVGILFLVARIWDAFNDPFMGMVVENTRSKWGKFRPWIMIGTVLNAIVLGAMFLNIDLGDVGYMIYCGIFYILWGMTYTIMDIPFWSMVPALTSDEKERNQVSAIPRLFASFAWLVVGTGGLYILDWLGNGDDKVGYQWFALIISVLFIIASIINVVNVREKNQIVKNSQKQEKTSVKEMLSVLVKNDQVKVILGIALFFNMAYQLSNGFALFYFKYVINEETLFATYTGVAGIAQMGAMALYPKVSEIIGKTKTFFLASFMPVLGFICLLAVGFIAPQNVILVGISSAIINIGIGVMLVSITVMLADVVDYGEYTLHKRSEGILFSMQTFIVKFAGAFSGFVSSVGLGLIGYIPDVQQGEGTILGMRIIMIVIPALLSALCFVIYKRRYKIKGEFYTKMMAALKAEREN